MDIPDGIAQTLQCLVLADNLGDFEHVRAFTFAYDSQTEGIHYVAHVQVVALDPIHHHGFCSGGRKIVEAGEQLGKLFHQDRGLGTPARRMGIDRCEVREEVKESIEYEHLRQELPYDDVESLLELIVDVLSSTASTMRIGADGQSG